jgi:hypothetical protein
MTRLRVFKGKRAFGNISLKDLLFALQFIESAFLAFHSKTRYYNHVAKFRILTIWWSASLCSEGSCTHGHVRFHGLRSYIGFEVLTSATMKNAVFWDMNPQSVPHRGHITSPLQSPAS